MPDFEDIPGEIFHQILSYIPRNHYAPYALVSRSWYSKVTPALYGNIDFVWRRPKLYCEDGKTNLYTNLCPCEEAGYCKPESHDESPLAYCQWRHRNTSLCIREIPCRERSLPPLYLLVRTMITTPALANLVYDLRLSGAVPRSVWTSPDQTELSLNDRHSIRSILHSSPRMECSEESLIRELDRGSPSAFAALLLVCANNIGKLELAGDFECALRFIGSVPKVVKYLPQLHTASIGVFHDGVFMGSGRTPFTQTANFDQLFLFHLPMIRHLSLNVPNPLANTTFRWPGEGKAPFARALESIELVYTHLNESNLTLLLEACPKLRTLKYDLWTTPADPDAWGFQRKDPYHHPNTSNEPYVNVSILDKALLMVRNTLETFHFHIQSRSYNRNQNLKRMSFASFACLTTLHIPFQMLLGADRSERLAHALPKSLVHLWLNDDGLRLWMDHERFLCPQDFETDSNLSFVEDPEYPDGVGDPKIHPVHTDEEVMSIVKNYLDEYRDFTPFLTSVKLLFYDISFTLWERRDVEKIAEFLEPRGLEAEVDVAVIMLPNRKYYSDFEIRDSSMYQKGQGPPYFDLDTIQRMRIFEELAES